MLKLIFSKNFFLFFFFEIFFFKIFEKFFIFFVGEGGCTTARLPWWLALGK